MVDNVSDDDLEMLDKRVGIHQHARPERAAKEELDVTCHFFFCGQQRITLDGGRLVPAPYFDDEDQTNYKANLIRQRVLENVVKLVNVHIDFAVRPPTGEVKDRERSETSNNVFRHQREITDFKYHQIISTINKAIYGSSFYKVFYNAQIGEPKRLYWTDDTGKAVAPAALFTRDQQRQKDALGQYDDIKPGDVSLGVLSPFQFFHDWSARDGRIESCHWVAEKHYVDIDRIADRWGVDPKDIQPVEISAGLANYEDAIASMQPNSWFGPLAFSVPRDKIRARTLYIEMWERPSRKFKKGRRLVYAGGKLLNAGDTDNPYAGDQTGWAHLPYVHDIWVPKPGAFFGSGMVEDMLSPQYHLNRQRGLLLDFMRKYGMPDTYVDEGGGIDVDKFQEGGGNLYEIKQGARVQPGPTPQIPAAVGVLGELLLSDLNMTASQGPMDADKLPGQLRSGSAIQTVMEDRYASLSVPTLGTVNSTRDVGRIDLALGRLFYENPRVMRYMGGGRQWIAQTYTGADLLNDVIVLGEPNVADTLSNQREQMLDAVAAGAFNPQYDKQTRIQIMSALRYNTSDELVRVQLNAKRCEENVIQEILANPKAYVSKGPDGKDILVGYPVLPWQDHETASDVLVDFMYSPQFEDLKNSQLGSIAQAVISARWQMHQQFIQRAQQQQMQLAEALKGMPGQSGQASQPRSK